MKKDKKGKKRKLNKKRLYIFLIIFLFIVLFVHGIFNVNISNIYVSGNTHLSDQEIIDISGLKDYPNSMKNLSYAIKNKLEDNQYILSANVVKKGFINKVYIDVKENYPLFFYQPEEKTVLYNGDKVTDKFTSITVINQIPNTVYDKFLKKMTKVNNATLNRISEIEYKANEVDDERFFLLMNDGNYVYLTLDKFLTINKYIDLVKSFSNKKGIFYLDSGEYFEVFDEKNDKLQDEKKDEE